MSDGHSRATRHTEGCGVLELAQRQHEDLSFNKRHVQMQAVVEDERYQRLVSRGVATAARDHTCIKTPSNKAPQESLL
jgi:hypothetical protein